jgi:hypothetical protein
VLVHHGEPRSPAHEVGADLGQCLELEHVPPSVVVTAINMAILSVKHALEHPESSAQTMSRKSCGVPTPRASLADESINSWLSAVGLRYEVGGGLRAGRVHCLCCDFRWCCANWVMVYGG